MRYIRRLITTLVGGAALCLAATTNAYAQLPDPYDGPINLPPATIPVAGTPVWEFVVTAGLGVLLALAVVGLIFSLRHPSTSKPARRSEQSPMSHA
jgi:hypothetical protein